MLPDLFHLSSTPIPRKFNYNYFKLKKWTNFSQREKDCTALLSSEGCGTSVPGISVFVKNAYFSIPTVLWNCWETGNKWLPHAEEVGIELALMEGGVPRTPSYFPLWIYVDITHSKNAMDAFHFLKTSNWLHPEGNKHVCLRLWGCGLWKRVGWFSLRKNRVPKTVSERPCPDNFQHWWEGLGLGPRRTGSEGVRSSLRNLIPGYLHSPRPYRALQTSSRRQQLALSVLFNFPAATPAGRADRYHHVLQVLLAALHLVSVALRHWRCKLSSGGHTTSAAWARRRLRDWASRRSALCPTTSAEPSVAAGHRVRFRVARSRLTAWNVPRGGKLQVSHRSWRSRARS